jgi:tetratricopeptide (TPR) repeat protein
MFAASLPQAVAAGASADEPDMTVAFVSDAPLTAQGPAGSANQLRRATSATRPQGVADGQSRLVVVDDPAPTPRTRFGVVAVDDNRPDTVAATERDDRKFHLPKLRFLGGSDDEAQDAPPTQSSIAVVEGNAFDGNISAGNQMAQYQNSPIFDPNVAQTSFRDAMRTQQVPLRNNGNRGGGGLFDTIFNNDNNNNDSSSNQTTQQQPGTRKPLFGGSSNTSQPVQRTQRQPSRQSLATQRQVQQPISQQLATSLPRGAMQPAPTPTSRQQLSNMTRNASVPAHRVAGNTPLPIGGRATTGATRPSPAVARRPSTPQLTAPNQLPTGQQSSLTSQPATQTGPLTAAQKHAQELIVAVHQQSRSAETEEDYTLVVESCRRALAVEPKGDAADYAKQLCGWALNRRGQLKADAGNDAAAMLDFVDAIRLDENQWRAVHNRGVLFAQAGQFEKAFDDFNLCTELNPRFAKAYSNRAALFVQAGDLLAALQDYRRAITLDPDLAVAHKGRGRVCHMLGSTDEALQHFDAAAQLSPNDAQVLASRADLLSDMGRYPEAAIEYHRAIMIDDQLAHAFRSSAWLMATCPDDAVRNAEQALAHAEKAVNLDNYENPVSLDTLAAALANAGQYDEAVRAIERAIEIAPPEERAVYRARLKLYQRSQPFRVSPVAGVATVGYDE